VNAKDKYGKTPLYLAAERGHKEVASLREKVEGHPA
jgi:ankyrin repeat protein